MEPVSIPKRLSKEWRDDNMDYAFQGYGYKQQFSL
jgi:hypothetical protein